MVGSTPARSAKLYGVGRADIPPGLRAAQLGHVLIAYALSQGPPPDNLVLVSNEEALGALQRHLQDQGIFVVGFREPDLDNELTALAVHPDGWKILSSLPLAFK